jgi:hypothetical protein
MIREADVVRSHQELKGGFCMNLYDLAFTSYFYNSFTSFNNSYKSLLKEVANELDLLNLEHRKALIIWLNKWGCRQFSLEFHEMAADEILSWYKEGHIELIPQDKKLWELTKTELGKISIIFDELAKRTASRKMRGSNLLSITVGSTGASKILFALRPEVAAPWDEAIRTGLKHSGDGASYVKYLVQIGSEIESLSVSCNKNGFELLNVPQELGRDEATIAQLIGEYFWITKTRKCYPPSLETIQRWAKWSS